MSLFEDIKLYLPKYLSPDAQDELFSELKGFPENLIKGFYTEQLKREKSIFQGDGWKKFPIIKLPDPKVGEGPVIVLSNTCDISPENKRDQPPSIIYCPIIRMSLYEDLVKRTKKSESINEHLKSVREQKISSLFYLPNIPDLGVECIALLDKINSCDSSYLLNKIDDSERLFSLNNYGFYLFLLKISIHLTRIREGIDRS